MHTKFKGSVYALCHGLPVPRELASRKIVVVVVRSSERGRTVSHGRTATHLAFINGLLFDAELHGSGCKLFASSKRVVGREGLEPPTKGL